MASIFRIDMLPAKDGDCLWIEYGSEDRPYRVLIDGGRSATYDVLKRRFEDLPESQRQFELGILTHVDADHIEGFLQLLKDSDRPISFKDFWFNGYHHLEMEDAEDLEDDDELEEFGGVQGDELSDALLTHEWPWNMAFGGKTVVVPDEGDLSTVELEGGMRLTLLAPTWPRLTKMRGQWKKEVEKAGLVPGAHVPEEEELEEEMEAFGLLDEDEVDRLASLPFKGDATEANGSSIAVLAEYGGKRILLSGDAQADDLVAAIDRVVESVDGRITIDAFKVSHHGSRKTLSNVLLQKLDCQSYLISSNGARHKHPDREAIARVLKHGGASKKLYFNYRTPFTLTWNISDLKDTFGFDTIYPPETEDGTKRVDLI